MARCDIAGTDGGTVIWPLTSARLAAAVVSLVVPASFDNVVSVGSSVSVMIVPGVAVGERVTCSWATSLPGAAPLSVKGIGLVVSLNESINEIVPEALLFVSNAGVNAVVTP